MKNETLRYLCLCLFGVAGAIAGIAAVQSVEAARKGGGRLAVEASATGTPEIRVSASNIVPACIKPDRLMRALVERNPKLEVQFQSIAQHYKSHGEKLRIRWDFAFYQMVHETNALLFTGDVRARQNNFAGLGATGGGVRGESFADVSTGVLAHLQHLVAYSGERVDNAVAQRTRENQDSIVAKSQKLGRAVRFADLTNRWAIDSKYTRMLEATAERFHTAACNGASAEPVASAPAATSAAVPAPIADPNAEGDGGAARKGRRGRDLARKAIEQGRTESAGPSGLGAAPAANCNVMAASFGGNVTLLIRAESTEQGVLFTALGVEGGSEDAMADSYMKVHAPGGRVAGRFKSRDDAVAHAYTLCDSGKP